MNACGGRLTIVSNQRHCRRTLGQTQTGQGLDMLNKGRALNFGQGRQGVGQMGDLGGRWCRVCAGFAPPGSECAMCPGILWQRSTPLEVYTCLHKLPQPMEVRRKSRTISPMTWTANRLLNNSTIPD